MFCWIQTSFIITHLSLNKYTAFIETEKKFVCVCVKCVQSGDICENEIKKKLHVKFLSLNMDDRGVLKTVPHALSNQTLVYDLQYHTRHCASKRNKYMGGNVIKLFLRISSQQKHNNNEKIEYHLIGQLISGFLGSVMMQKFYLHKIINQKISTVVVS